MFESRPWLFPSPSSSQEQEIETIFATQTCAHDVERELAHEKFSENPRERKKEAFQKKEICVARVKVPTNATDEGEGCLQISPNFEGLRKMWYDRGIQAQILEFASDAFRTAMLTV